MGQRSLAGYSPWGRQESDTTERLTLSPLLLFYSGPADRSDLRCRLSLLVHTCMDTRENACPEVTELM